MDSAKTDAQADANGSADTQPDTHAMPDTAPDALHDTVPDAAPNADTQPDTAPDTAPDATPDTVQLPSPAQLTIALRWIKNYPSEQQPMLEKGLLWALSMLGAELPVANKAALLQWQGAKLTVDLSQAGFPAFSLPPLAKLVAALKASGEHKTHGAIDVGRFVAVTYNSVWHYYAITGAQPSYQAFRKAHGFPGKVGWVVNSIVAKGDRRIEGAPATAHDEVAWLADEGTGSLVANTFVATEHETLAPMPNGQLRYALYGKDGALKVAGDPSLSAAGRPANCAFCHEGQVSPTFSLGALHPSQMTEAQFDALQKQHNGWLQAFRKTKQTLIHFDVDTDHSYLEKVYVGFLEPSAQRLADEWGQPLATVQAKLKGMKTHEDSRYHVFEKQLYQRYKVDPLAPYASVPVPQDKWAGATHEPNLL